MNYDAPSQLYEERQDVDVQYGSTRLDAEGEFYDE
jgi:hypothetical protein